MSKPFGLWSLDSKDDDSWNLSLVIRITTPLNGLTWKCACNDTRGHTYKKG